MSKYLTQNQRAALHRMDLQDSGEGIKLRKVTGEALLRLGLCVELRNGRYAKK